MEIVANRDVDTFQRGDSPCNNSSRSTPESPESDTFIHLLGDSLKDLHRNLVTEYQRTRLLNGNTSNMPKPNEKCPLWYVNASTASPKNAEALPAKGLGMQKGDESLRGDAPLQLYNKSEEQLSMISTTSKGQVRNVKLTFAGETSASTISWTPCESGAATILPQSNDDVPSRSPSGQTCSRVSTLREVFLVHEIYETTGKEGHSKKTAVGKRTMNPSPTMKMKTLDSDALSNIEYLDRSFLDWFDCLVCTQTSRPRILWEILGALLVLLDVIEIPLQLSFQLPNSDSRRGLAWFQRMYWTIDCISLFFTSYTSQKGAVVKRMRRIVLHYVRTWFPIDAFVLFFDWFDFVGKQVGLFSVFQGIRVIRLVKLLRAAHIAAHMPEVLDSMFASKEHSEGLKLLGSTVKMMFGAALLLHVIACLWHAIGRHSLLDDSGWLYYHIHERSLDTSVLHIYLVSYHWSITQLIGSADIYPHGSLERAFAILVLFLAFVISASVVSSITTSMTAIQFITSRKQKQLDRLKHYLVGHNIQSAIAHRVLQNAMYALEETHRNVQESEVELLGMISEPLYIELHHAMYKDFLNWHPFFSYYMEANNQAIRQVCHVCLTQTMIHGGDVLFSFSEQKQQPQMYFLLSGRMLYAKPRKTPTNMVESDWASEHVLWTSWTHVGGLRAKEPSSILCVDSYLFQNTANQFRSSAFWPSVYAQGFVALLNETDPDELTDLDERWTIDVWSLARSIFDPEDDTGSSTRLTGRGTIRASMWGFFGVGKTMSVSSRKIKLNGRLSAQSVAKGPQSKASLRAVEVGEQVARGSMMSQMPSTRSGRSSNESFDSELGLFHSTCGDGIDCPQLGAQRQIANEHDSQCGPATSKKPRGSAPTPSIISVTPIPPGLIDAEDFKSEDLT